MSLRLALIIVYFLVMSSKRCKQYVKRRKARCVVNLFKEYKRCIPETGQFYRRPFESTEPGDIKFGKQPVGINTLSKYLWSMCITVQIDIEGRRFSNHSGKVTCATTLYESRQFDEQTTMSRTNHLSTAVRSYKRPSNILNKLVSDVPQPPAPKTLNNAVKKTKNLKEEEEECHEKRSDVAVSTRLVVEHGNTRLSFHFE